MNGHGRGNGLAGTPDGEFDAVIVGGGIAGLAAGALLARAGRRIALLEAGNRVGGRAYAYRDQGFTLNYGPHGVYGPETGVLPKVLARLGLPPIRHGYPDPRRSFWSLGGHWGAIGQSPLDALTTPLFPPATRLRLLPLMGAIRLRDPEAVAGMTLGEWVDRHTSDPLLRRFALGLATLNTYTRPAAGLDAAFVLRHFRRHMFSRDYVGYMSGGWGTMYEAFADVIRARGGELHTGTRVTALHVGAGQVVAAVTAHRRFPARAFVVTLPPQETPDLAEEGSPLRQELEARRRLQDARALCIDLGFDRRLRTDLSFIFDIDRDLYFSLHSEVTPDLAPAGGQLLHAMAYLSPEEALDEALNDVRHGELVAGLDRHFPGWREAAVVRRTLPNAIVTSVRQTVQQQGAARVPARAGACRNLYFAGDGRDLPYNLSETSLASALEVADLLLPVLSTEAAAAAAIAP